MLCPTNPTVCHHQLLALCVSSSETGQESRRGSPYCPPPCTRGQLPAEVGTDIQKQAVLVSKAAH